jgi:hypothetical protein
MEAEVELSGCIGASRCLFEMEATLPQGNAELVWM